MALNITTASTIRMLKTDEHEPKITYRIYWNLRAFIVVDGGKKQDEVEFRAIDILFETTLFVRGDKCLKLSTVHNSKTIFVLRKLGKE